MISNSEHSDPFWKVALAQQARPESPIYFIPFELSLTDAIDVTGLKCDLDSVLEPSSWSSSDVENTQIAGSIRIYPHGIGVVRLALALTFKNDVNVELVAQVVSSIEDLYFVDAVVGARPCKDILFDVVDRTASAIFEGKIPTADLCWLPPSTTFSMVAEDKDNEEILTRNIAHLMFRAPGNNEDEEALVMRVHKAVKSNNWQVGKLLTVAGTGVGVICIGTSVAKALHDKLRRFQVWFKDSHELVSVAAYSMRALAEEVNSIFDFRTLDDDWLPGKGTGKFEVLVAIIREMSESKRARTLLKFHLERLGIGALKAFANQVWSHSETGQAEHSLNYIQEWAETQAEPGSREEFQHLLRQLRDLRNMPEAFKKNCPVA